MRKVFLEEGTTPGIYDGVASSERDPKSQNLPVCMSLIPYQQTRVFKSVLHVGSFGGAGCIIACRHHLLRFMNT